MIFKMTSVSFGSMSFFVAKVLDNAGKSKYNLYPWRAGVVQW